MSSVLITGASSGFGVEFADIFASKGYDLILVARSEDKLNKVKSDTERKYGIHTDVFVKDLSDWDAAKDVYEFAKNKDVEILVNNAGFGDYALFAESKIDKQKNMICVNDVVLMELTHLFLPDMIKKNKGKILNLASVASFEAGPKMAVYYASKAFVLSFSESLATELKNIGITVTALCPGPTNTGFTTLAEMNESRFADVFRTATARSVAEYGVKALMKGKVIAIPGWTNRMAMRAVKIMPRALTRKIMYRIQSV